MTSNTGLDWRPIDRKYPSKYNQETMQFAEYRKARTIELYDYLPQTTLEERYTYNDIRDAIIDLNYQFFGYIASHKFVNNSYISYEDKFQAALLHFCEMWHKYRYEFATYRTDVAFGVFFKPRITECMERDFDEVKYSLRRTLCMEVGKQLGKHWAKVSYEDLSDPRVTLTPEKMVTMQAVFGSMYVADLETHAMFIPADNICVESNDIFFKEYDNLTDMLIHEMVELERDLNEKDVERISGLLGVPKAKIDELLVQAREKLHKLLIEKCELRDAFS